MPRLCDSYRQSRRDLGWAQRPGTDPLRPETETDSIVNKPKAQGTAWESEFVRRCKDAGLLADRMPEGGMNDAGDVWIGDTPKKATEDIAVVAWSRLVKGNGIRRVADGVRTVVIIDTDDFLRIAQVVDKGEIAFVVECKAREVLNVTRELDKAQEKLRRWKER